jgi:hypothetical protein
MEIHLWELRILTFVRTSLMRTFGLSYWVPQIVSSKFWNCFFRIGFRTENQPSAWAKHNQNQPKNTISLGFGSETFNYNFMFYKGFFGGEVLFGLDM